MIKINNKTILKAAKKFSQYGGADIDYTKCVDNLSRVKNLNKVSNGVVKEVIDFLVAWKCRGLVGSRSKNKEKYSSQVKSLKDALKLKKMTENLKELKKYNLKDIPINKKYLIIQDIYETIRQAGFGPTATSKIMHIINPSLFVMWDTAMRADKYYRCKSATPNQYIEFMKKIQNICKTLKIKQKEVKITVKRKPTLVKMIDEANYIMITKNIRL